MSSDDDYWGQYDVPSKDTPKPGMEMSPCAAEESFSRQTTADTFSRQTTSPTSLASSCEPLPGGLVSVGLQKFHILRQLGTGSFGTVWLAERCSTKALVAVKEVLCFSVKALEAVKSEVRHLSLLAGQHQVFPTLITAGSQPLGAGTTRAMVVMSHAPGEPLLEALQAGCLSRQVDSAHAFRVTAQLLEQLASAMQRIECLLHRDAHAQNILVEAGAGTYRFSLVDFGLAVDATAWRSGGWRLQGAAGDCRYWPTSAWRLFSMGPEALLEEELQQEYTMQLDMHSVGLTALQLLVQSSPSSELLEAWLTYWCPAMQLWQQVLDAFNTGRQADLKLKLAKESIHADVASRLRLLRCKLQDALPRQSAEAKKVLQALLLMISEGRPRPGKSPCWEEVLQVLGKSSLPGASNSCKDEISAALLSQPVSIFEPGTWRAADEEEEQMANLGYAKKPDLPQMGTDEDSYWFGSQWDPDERVYVGAATSRALHFQAILPK
eukprot:CAMPEP_0197648118 /NCGR_PEP_ID=MMETSP1338-20131121/27560_1 /TAXON_ID=43686 ORGANISM="Pelagodinium beii, Strain RCC1491" /NCGR_SAMPLE_ID=MMETSP1338 /ASSEMBLY_ACC=CAM_ASM_000754 /LENGTH=492 /DNA_ID=CAMNT_0043222059 /DNA_START=33 /DNA_END=1511 /DNA_ORIENTATION=+